jgi:DNA-binding LacI/PurR family transcriptional regulator
MVKHQTTIKEIADALGVSVSTVSRALKDDPRIGLRTKMRVSETAKAMHYIPNPAAKSLRKPGTPSIGVIVPQLREEFFSLAITGIEDVFEGKDLHIFISQSRDKFEREAKATQFYLQNRVNGIIASIAAETTDYAHFAELQEFGVPVVFFDRVPNHLPAHRVRSNVQDGVLKALGYLAERGLQRVALLNGPKTLGISQERLQGYLAALKVFNLEPVPGYIKYTDLGRADIEAKMEELWHLTEERPQAVLAFNDYVALGASKWCSKHQIRPNKDVFFVSFANLPLTDYLDHPPAASLEQYAYQMGHNAANLLLQLLEGDRPAHEPPFTEIIMDTDLVVHI